MTSKNIRYILRIKNKQYTSACSWSTSVCFGSNSRQWAMTSSFTRPLTSHNDAPQSVGHLWTSDQLVAERPLPDNTHNTHNGQISMPLGGIRTPRSQQASSRRPTPNLTVTLHPFYGRFLTLASSADPSVDHALPIVLSHCTRSSAEFMTVFNGTSCGVH